MVKTANIKSHTFKSMPTTEANLIDKIESEANKGEYIKRPIRNDVASKRKKSIIIKQKLMGFFLIILTIFILYFTSVSIPTENGDVTVVLLMVPMGLYLLFTRRIVIR